MQGTYIRDLNIYYRDPTQRTIYDEQLPKKFLDAQKKQQYLYRDDYKKKPLITVIRPPSVKPQPIASEQSCFTRFFKCLTVDLCSECRGMLCEQCRNTKFLKLFICDFCQKQLCPGCRRTFEGKKTKLRNYRIKLKNIKQLHFKDCQCEDCEKDKHQQ